MNDVDLRKKIEDDLKHEFDHEVRSYVTNIDQLTNERNEKDARIQRQNEQLSAAKVRFQETENDVQKLRSELEIARNDRIEMDTRLKTEQRAAQIQSDLAAEITSMKQQLRQKDKALEDEEKEFGELRRAYDNLVTQHSNLRTTCEQQQIEIYQHPSKIESLRREIEHEFFEKQQKEYASTKEARNEALNMRKERDDVQSKLQQTQLHGSQLTKAHAALVGERDVLKQRITELEITSKDNETRMHRQEKESITRDREHEQKLNELQSQLERSNEAVRVVEAKVRLQQAEHAKKLEFDRNKYEALVQNLTRDLEKARNHGSKERNTTEQSSQSAAQYHAVAHGAQNSNSKKSRKKVDRGNYSLLKMTGLHDTAGNPTMMPMTSACTQSSQGEESQFDRNDNLFEEESGHIFGEDNPWEQSLSLVNPAAEPVEDTQEMPSIRMVLNDMDELASPQSSRTSPLERALPEDQSSLSSPPPSDELARLSDDNRRLRTPNAEACVVQSNAHTQHDEHDGRVLETPKRGRNAYNCSSQSSQSQGRPLSQANTSSRMMPPPPTGSNPFSRYATDKEVSRRGALGELGRSSQESRPSSPGIVQEPYTANARPSDSHESEIAFSTRSGGHQTSTTSGGDRKQKRKVTSEQQGSAKRQRESSQSYPFNRSSRISSNSSRSSHSEQGRQLMAGAIPFQSHPSSSLPPVSPAANSGSKNNASAHGSEHVRSSSKSRDNQTSASKFTTPARSHRVYGRHQTRSKSEWQELS